MDFALKYFLFLVFLFPCLGQEELVNKEFIQSHLTKQAQWSCLHGAQGDYLGSALLYYALVYSMKAKVCVCLGSGDGFVPRMMRQAQRDLNLEDSKTILVDGNQGIWGRPHWIAEKSFFKENYPEIEIIIDSTRHVAQEKASEWQIDYLHIDADRSIRGAFRDFQDYVPFMAKHGIITLHDTGPLGPCRGTVKLIKELGYTTLNLEHFGSGVTLILPHSRVL